MNRRLTLIALALLCAFAPGAWAQTFRLLANTLT